jgi:8-oxo-dGTP pyrophosphatase MutT (NUDIX family)
VSTDPASLLAHAGIADVARRLAGYEGALARASDDVRRAAVALVLRPADERALDLLFIKRADYPGDPWSGQIAFPGGRHEPTDASLRETAARETWGETGVDLARDGLFLGALDELGPQTPVLPPIVVRPYVAVVAPGTPLVLSDEVAAAFWAPLDALRRPDATFEAAVVVRGEERHVPALRHADYTIWGMTERIFRNFLARLAAE